MVIDVRESNNAFPSSRRADRGPPIATLVTTPVPHKRKRTEGGEGEPNKRSVRMPKWEATLFNVSDDWYRHQALFQTELSKFPGLSGSQKSQFLLGSLNPTLRAAATAFHFGQGFPRAEIILGHMARTFPNTPGNSGEDWDASLQAMVQQPSQTLMHYLDMVQNKLNQYKLVSESQFSIQRLAELTNQAYFAIAFRIREPYRKLVEAQQQRWEADEKPEYPPYKDNRYLNVFTFLVRLVQNESATHTKSQGHSEKTPAKKIECRFGSECTRKDTCRFMHSNVRAKSLLKKEAPKEPWKPKEGLPTCTHCGKYGHAEASCFKKNPELRTRGK